MRKIITTLLLIFLLSSGFGTNYYIATNGSDGNNGTTLGTPKKTFSTATTGVFAAFNLGSGDTVFVAAGTYTETGITVGTDDEGFVIQGSALSNGVPTSIFDAGSTARWMLLGNTNNDNITINNLTIKDHKTIGSSNPDGGGAVKVISGAINLKINYCVFDNCDTKLSSGHRGGAIYAVEYITVNSCVFINCDGDSYGGAISIELTPVSNSYIKYCKFYQNNTNSSNYGTALFFGVSSSSTLTVENCLFYDNGVISGESVIVCMNSYSTLSIINSTIAYNGSTSYGTGGILCLSSATINAKNCIIYSNSGTSYNDAYKNSGTFTMTNCMYGVSGEVKSMTTITNCVIANPLFTDSSTDDYTLQVTSPAIDTGNVTNAPIDDIRGYTRVGDPDMGCFEYGASAPTYLPIQLLSFSGNCKNNLISLYWTTASELNNNYFGIERGEDGINYTKIGEVSGSGNSTSIINYQFRYIDTSNIEVSYYRLIQVDYDDKETYFNPISISCSDKNISRYIIPNPVREGENWVISGSLPTDSIRIYDMTGRSVVNLLRGVYIIKVNNIFISKLIVN